jgi:hypothetical protein
MPWLENVRDHPMTVLKETNSHLVLGGIVHRMTGIRHIDQDGDPEDDYVVLDIEPHYGAMLDVDDRLALARWLLVGTWHTIITEVHT